MLENIENKNRFNLFFSLKQGDVSVVSDEDMATIKKERRIDEDVQSFSKECLQRAY